MSENGVTTTDLQPGTEWTFVHSSGKRTLYLYDKLLVPASPGNPPKQLPLDAMHSLLNPATGKCAQVTERWLCGMRWGGSHWLVGNHVAAPVAA
jgi:hypothetical protein